MVFAIRAIIAALVLIIGFSSHAIGGTMEVPIGTDESGMLVVTPAYIDQSLKVDGKIGELAWRNAATVGDFKLVQSGLMATQQTTVKLCYDKNMLYLAFECLEDRMDQLKAEYSIDSEPVWQDDSIEVYIAPNSVADAGNCHHFSINVAGAKTYVQPGWETRNDAWYAAVSKMDDRWIAEMAIPFKMLRPAGRNDAFWRINLCRNEIRLGELSSWSAVPAKYATYSQFGKLSPSEGQRAKFTLFRGNPLLLEADSSAQTGAEAVTEPAPVPKGAHIIPEPVELRFHRSDAFNIKPDTRIYVNADAQEADLWAADQINDAIERLGGKRLSVVRSSVAGQDPARVHNAIIIGECDRNRLLDDICRKDYLFLPRIGRENGAYAMNVVQEYSAICGTSAVNTFYGVQSFKQLLKKTEDGTICVPAVTVRDAPKFQFRGVHLLATRDGLSYLGKLITNVLAPLKVNHIVLQIDNIEWKSHPEIVNPKTCMPREDIPKLLEIARRHHITVTPLVQCPGHFAYALNAPENRHLAEDPNDPYCYCMSNPESYKLVYELMNEAIELFGHPEYVHAGHDEFDMRGVIPYDERCKAIGKQRLYVDHIRKIYDHLKSKDCKMMIWGDMLSRNDYRDLLGDVPKDILINDWRYSPEPEYPSIDLYQSYGFTVVGCTWYDPRNITLLSKYADNRRILGMLHTTWTGWADEQTTLKNDPHQLYAYILATAWAWNPSRPSLDSLPYRPDTIFNKMWFGDQPMRQPNYSVVRLDKHCNISRADSGRSVGWLGYGHSIDLRQIPEGIVWMEGVPYLILPAKTDTASVVLLGGRAMPKSFPKRVEGIEVDHKVTALHFLHGCAHGAERSSKAGSYVIHYEDGKTETVGLAYPRDISAWDDQSTALTYGFAWRNKARDGRTIGVVEFTWKNPNPDLKVKSIDFIANHPEASPFLLALTAEE